MKNWAGNQTYHARDRLDAALRPGPAGDRPPVGPGPGHRLTALLQRGRGHGRRPRLARRPSTDPRHRPGEGHRHGRGGAPLRRRRRPARARRVGVGEPGLAPPHLDRRRRRDRHARLGGDPRRPRDLGDRAGTHPGRRRARDDRRRDDARRPRGRRRLARAARHRDPPHPRHRAGVPRAPAGLRRRAVRCGRGRSRARGQRGVQRQPLHGLAGVDVPGLAQASRPG